MNIQYKLETPRDEAIGVDSIRLSTVFNTALRSRFRVTCGPNSDVRQYSLGPVEMNTITTANIGVDRMDATPLTVEDYRFIDEAFINACRATFHSGGGWSTQGIANALSPMGTSSGRVSLLGAVRSIQRIVNPSMATCTAREVPAGVFQSHQVVSSTAPSEVGTTPSAGLAVAATNAARRIQNTVNDALGEYKTPVIVGGIVVGTLVGGFFVWRITAK